MSWCMDCGTEGRPIAATTTVDGDPLCAAHAKARGVEVEASSVHEEKVMGDATGLCGCGRDGNHKGRCAFRRQNGAKGGGGVTVRRKSPTLAARVERVKPLEVIDIASKGAVLDHVWSTLTPELKLQAITALIS